MSMLILIVIFAIVAVSVIGITYVVISSAEVKKPYKWTCDESTGNCTSKIGEGNYDTQTDCETACGEFPKKWSCQGKFCVEDKAGIYTTLEECQDKCYWWSCGEDDKCHKIDNGEYQTSEQCQKNCPYTGRWTCFKGREREESNRCEKYPSGEYTNLNDCKKACTSTWQCDNVFTNFYLCHARGPGVGPFKSESECESSCKPYRWTCDKSTKKCNAERGKGDYNEFKMCEHECAKN